MMWEILAASYIYATFLYALTHVGNIVCRQVLRWSGATIDDFDGVSKSGKTSSAGQNVGWMIGSLERLLIMLGLIANSWEVMIAVVALKTIARHQEIDKKPEAEYFLIGSMASFLWALTVSAGLVAYDHACGFGLVEALRSLMTTGPSL